ncbi:2-hydroxyacyl-CoA dehydratase subunit D [Agathobacter ruminis]|uniref:Benzoyl-CoA reductase n=1 Tax=Agathobacter ruminis TaxID=1712665 RepID=A0A2G3E0Y7_9FIRM|nr:2-hydroxyacyl-CoA dehydratase family protein [Agathobacter ruminis]MDC7300454.1 2-hydroxyacyl-CoA dehydratase family protein [Agathobacter ruminis]PHU36942.1 benzoyl-CoA reductase [Agathobacter ruminis]
MNTAELFEQFHKIALNPRAQKDAYLKDGEKVVLVTYYVPEQLIHAMGAIPFHTYGGDLPVNEAKQYFPAFICSVMQTMLELGMRGTFEGCSAIVIPSLCDSLKCIGQNWKYAVPSIPFIPLTYPQNRKPDYGAAFTRAGYERMVRELEAATGLQLDETRLKESIRIYNEHNALMREFSALCAEYPQVTATQRSDVYKSAGFMKKEEHAQLLRELIACMKQEVAQKSSGKRIYISGILADAPEWNRILEDYGLQVVGDDILACSRLYRDDCRMPEDGEDAMDALVRLYCDKDHCSLLYDEKKSRVEFIVQEAKQRKADGVILALTKFCDPEEFDNPMIKDACAEAGLPCVVIEMDRQMQNYEQARTIMETFADMIG